LGNYLPGSKAIIVPKLSSASPLQAKIFAEETPKTFVLAPLPHLILLQQSYADIYQHSNSDAQLTLRAALLDNVPAPLKSSGGFMSEEGPQVPAHNCSPVLRNVLLAVAAVYVIASLYLTLDMRGRLDKLEKAQTTTSATVKESQHRLGNTESTLKASTEALASKLGMTEKELSQRTADLQHQQRAAELRIAEQHKKAIGQVTGEVAGVKTELGSARTDIAATRTDLEVTKAKLERAIGDLGLQSGLIAHTRNDLEYLKHKGDRNIYEFTLTKGSQPTPVSTVSLQLKKSDQKKGRFTLNLLADDRTIEKKDRTVYEPLQFYTGRDKSLYEVVVMSVDKNKVTGYLSTPKNAPAPPQ
jgi:hypothetical protein